MGAVRTCRRGRVCHFYGGAMEALMQAFGTLIVLTLAVWIGELLMRIFPERRAELLALRIARRVRRIKTAIDRGNV